MRTGVILMTALVPTIGHQYLIQWAHEYFWENFGIRSKLHVIIATRDHEPTTFKERYDGLVHYSSIDFHNINDNNAPQNPSGDDDETFWNYWRDAIRGVINRKKIDFVFSSEFYGNKLAEVLNAIHIPVDPYREINEVKGTNVRNSLRFHFNKLAPNFQSLLRKRIIFFGAESTGKTTTAKWAAQNLNGHYVHEWARPYLETVGPDLTEAKMLNIFHGQKTTEQMLWRTATKPFVFQDTDLLSTIGYYRILGWTVPYDLIRYYKARQKYRNLYIVLDTDIPFQPDPLRYGGTVRESDTKFWTDLLDEFGEKYIVFRRGEHWQLKLTEIIIDTFDKDAKVQAIQNFVRD